MAWNARFVYRNYVDDSTVTASDEVATLPDGNLQAFQPSEVWRADTLSSLDVQVVGGSSGPREWDTVWLGYTNLTPKRNLLRASNTLNGGVWTLDNALIVENTNLNIAPKVTDAWRLIADGAGSVTHGISQIWTPTLTMKANQEFTHTFHINDSEASTPADGVELAMVTNASAAVSVELEFSGGTLSAVTDGSGWSDSSASVSSVVVGATTSYKVTLTATQANVITSMTARVRQVVGGSTSFVQSAEEVYLAQGFMSLGDVSDNEEETTTESAAGFRLVELDGSTTISDYYAALPRDLTEWDSDLGWVHGVAYVGSAVRSATSWQLLISDENNLDSYVEAGRLVIGKSFQPSGKLLTDGISGAMSQTARTYEGGRRVFDLEFEYLDATTAERDFLDMYQHVKKREGFEVESVGGHRYAPDNRPVLCILDDAAGTSEPERVIYGTLEGQPVVSQFGTKFRTSIRIKELPK